jgi:RNA polymerase sigma-70 factor, ECF subfamily
VEVALSASDESLLARTAAEPEVFGVFYRRHEDRVVRYFLRRGATPELAADLTAEVFAAALVAADRFRPGPQPAEAWLYGIARRTLAMSRRRGRVEARARRRLGMPPLELTDEVIERIIELEEGSAATASLNGLPESERQAIEARVLGEQNYADIAARLRCSEAVVRKRVSRGLARLRAELSREES